MLDWFNTESERYDVFTDQVDEFNLGSWYAVSISAAIWIGIYYALRYAFITKSAEWCNRLVTLLHGLGITIRGLQECVQEQGEWAFESPDEDSTRNQMLLLVISLGYFIFDLGWCLAYETETNLMVFHHIYSCIALYRILVSEVSGAQACCGLAAMEITNPLLQLRWFLRSEGFYNTAIFKIVELSFIGTFIFVRILGGTYFFCLIMFYYPNEWEFRFLTLVIYILSWMFLANIVKFIYLKYIDQKERIVDNDIHTSTS